jgi:hypothetical protein
MNKPGHQATFTHLQNTLILLPNCSRGSPGLLALGLGLFGGPIGVKIALKFLPLALAKIDSIVIWPYTNSSESRTPDDTNSIRTH